VLAAVLQALGLTLIVQHVGQTQLGLLPAHHDSLEWMFAVISSDRPTGRYGPGSPPRDGSAPCREACAFASPEPAPQPRSRLARGLRTADPDALYGAPLPSTLSSCAFSRRRGVSGVTAHGTGSG